MNIHALIAASGGCLEVGGAINGGCLPFTTKGSSGCLCDSECWAYADCCDDIELIGCPSSASNYSELYAVARIPIIVELSVFRENK